MFRKKKEKYVADRIDKFLDDIKEAVKKEDTDKLAKLAVKGLITVLSQIKSYKYEIVLKD